jgi:HD-like signal output (HDOD) protein/CheY-like chemotaxis protein
MVHAFFEQLAINLHPTDGMAVISGFEKRKCMTEGNHSILFVDDDAEIIASTRRFLYTSHLNWQITFANSAVDALTCLMEREYDVVVSDIRMPGMSGIDFLDHMRLFYPHSVRIALSGHSDRASSLRISGLAHQYLVKPCPIETLMATIQQVLKGGNLGLDENLRKLIAQLKTIPSQPSAYLKIVEELKHPDPSMGRVGKIISQDVSMSAKILQLVNSPFFGLPQNVIDPTQAAVLLGIETVRDLVLTVGVFSQFDDRKMNRLKLASLWDHSQRTGRLAKTIAIARKANAKQINDAMIAGLLHDVGKLILADNFSQQYQWVNQACMLENLSVSAGERKVFGASHAQVGAYLFSLWGLSAAVQNAVAWHHEPSSSTARDAAVLMAVHAANAIDFQLNPGQPAVGAPPVLDDVFIRLNGAEDDFSDLEQYRP